MVHDALQMAIDHDQYYGPGLGLAGTVTMFRNFLNTHYGTPPTWTPRSPGYSRDWHR